MAHKDGEASVEDILRSIKQVISRDEGARRPLDGYPRDTAREPGDEGSDGIPPRTSSFSPYSFQRHSPFGARQPETPPPSEEIDEGVDEGRTDVFDLRSLDSDAFIDDEDDAETAAEPESYAHAEPEPEDEPITLQPPAELADLPEPSSRWSPVSYDEEDEDEEAPAPYVEDALPVVSDDDDTEDQPAPVEQVIETVEEAVVVESVELVEPEPEPVIEAQAESEAETETAPDPEAETASEPQDSMADGLIAGGAADALRDRFSALQAAASATGGAAAAASTPANPLEDMVREMMRPMLKQWLDDNMPSLVEKIVEREIARITGRL